MQKNRREFLNFLGRSGLVVSSSAGLSFLLSACQTSQVKPKVLSTLPFKPIQPSFADDVVLAEGFRYHILIRQGDQIGDNLYFGDGADFTAFFEGESPNEGFLWVNHESFNPLFTSGFDPRSGAAKTEEQMQLEKTLVGGSFLQLVKRGGKWNLVTDSDYNHRWDANTPIPFAKKTEIMGATTAIGTLANCAGGVTPWETILSCEENYQQFYGDITFENGTRQLKKDKKTHRHSWQSLDQKPPEHYGWVVEINPFEQKAKKLVALGRFAHEGATCIETSDGRCVVYMGDDEDNQYFYKFVSKEKESLDEGSLYVADFKKKRWLLLDRDSHPVLKKNFSSQLDLLIQTRKAATLLGATPLDRPEDCEIDPVSGAIFVACTNNKKAGRPHGEIRKIIENKNDYAALSFDFEIFKTGGTDFSCPDNMAFDKKGNMWLTVDISEQSIGDDEYKKFGHNALFYIPLSGEHAGKVLQFASAPKDAEFTGPSFSADGSTLFLSVQQPGTSSLDKENPTSKWPRSSPDGLPKSSVIQIDISSLVK